MQLIRHRGPKRFTTEFEKSLLAAQTINIVSLSISVSISVSISIYFETQGFHVLATC